MLQTTLVRIKKETHDHLVHLGKYGDSFLSDLLSRSTRKRRR